MSRARSAERAARGLGSLSRQACSRRSTRYRKPRHTLYDWAGHAQRLLAQFRLDWVRFRPDPRFDEVIDATRASSAYFRDWWPRHDVQGRLELTKQVCPTVFGRPITYVQSTWALSTSPGLRLVIYAPDGETNRALNRECLRSHLASRPTHT
ncbi:MAG: hypothetical protein HY262_03720 [Chloroflexi bacterium]|nr:hypothetical protein [Chloroflexota bacterium]